MTQSTHQSHEMPEFVDEEEEEEQQNNIVTQAELFKSYSEQNALYVNQCLNIFWFEYGGRKIGKLNMDIIKINQNKMRANQQDQDSECSDPDVEAARQGKHYVWRGVGKFKDEFAAHQAVVIDTQNDHFYIMGCNGNKNSNLRYDQKTIKTLSPMPCEKTFFATVFHDGIIYTFGGYDAYDKIQMNSSEYYNIRKDKWFNSELLNPQGKTEFKLHQSRS